MDVFLCILNKTIRDMDDWKKIQEISDMMDDMSAELKECSKLLTNIETKIIKILK